MHGASGFRQGIEEVRAGASSIPGLWLALRCRGRLAALQQANPRWFVLTSQVVAAAWLVASDGGCSLAPVAARGALQSVGLTADV